MARAENHYREDNAPSRGTSKFIQTIRANEWTKTWWFRLLAFLLFAELIFPFILWKAGFPQSLDFLKEVVAALIISLTFAYMLLRNHIPMAVLLMIGVSLIWGLVATLDGQSIAATVWGWWRFFKYPLLMVFSYLIPRWPKDFPRMVIRFITALVIFEVGLQLIQFAMGQTTGDSLAGTFAWKGVMQFSMFIFFSVCIALGLWLATGEWKTLLIVLALGLVGTMLSVTKFYLIAVALMGVFTLVLHMIRGGQIRQLFLYIVLFSIAAAAFVPIYNNFLTGRLGLRPLQAYLTVESLESYLLQGDQTTDAGMYKLGRGAAVIYAWQQIQRDNTTLLFGYGAGSRTYSTSLGVAGNTLEDDLYNGGGATGLGVWIQEYGLVGLGLFLAMNFWIMFKLFKHAKTTSDRYLAALEYALIIFTFFWPVWLWYHKAWLAGVMMTFYWVILGYVFQQIYKKPRRRRARLSAIPSSFE